VGIQAVENNLLTPLVQQEAVSIPPVVLIVSQVLMGLLVGIIGMAIATPMAALAIKLVDELYVKRQKREPPESQHAGKRDHRSSS